MENKRELPTLAELQQDFNTAFKQDQLNLLCYQPIPKAWIKKHMGRDYLPVDKVEFLLTRIFGRWRREIKSVGVVANSVMATVRLYVWNPTYQEWDWNDGVGAMPIQMDSGASQSDVDAMKKNAIQIGGPAAVSYALKDAAECFGPIFGKDLNKKEALEFTGSLQGGFTPPATNGAVQINDDMAGSDEPKMF